MKKLSLYVLALSFAAFACKPATQEPAETTPDMAALEAEIQAMEDAYAAAENAKDVEGVLAYYSDDAVSLAHEKPALVGKDAIRQDIAARLSDTTRTGTSSFKVLDIMVDGDLLVETGASMMTDAEGVTTTTGKYVSIFQKRDGKWICVRDIWNADMPEKEQTAQEPSM